MFALPDAHCERCDRPSGRLREQLGLHRESGAAAVLEVQEGGLHSGRV